MMDANITGAGTTSGPVLGGADEGFGAWNVLLP
jgi:hypothetical protein